MSFTVKIDGVDALRSLLKAEKLYRPAIRKAMSGIGRAAKATVQGNAPVYRGEKKKGVEAGAYRRSVSFRATYSSVTISVKARNSRGFSYPTWLEFSPKSPYRGRFREEARRIVQDAKTPLNEAAREIEQAWRT